MALGNVHITPQLVQAVRDAADIVTVASDHTRLRKAGRRWQGLCPIHKEKTPSFSVDPVQGLFYCFGCGSGGDAIKLHMLTTGDDFPAAIEALAMRYGIPLPTRSERRGGRGEERDLEGALQAAAEFFVDQLKQAPGPQRYLAERKIPRELVERFGLGYAPEGWRNLVAALHPRVPLADLEAAGLVARPEGRAGDPYDRFRHRLMFPIHNPSGRLVGFGGRTLGDDKAKYINTSETERFHKGNILYGLHQAKREIRETGRAALVEGYFDVIGSVACGVLGAVAGMGTALTPEQAKLLTRYAEEVVVGYDGDTAGENAFRRALPLLLGEGMAVRRARFPDGHDPDSLRLEQGEQAVAEAFGAAADAVVLEIERLVPQGAAREPQLQAKAAKEVAELLRPIPDAILRFSYARIAAGHLQVPVEMLSRRIDPGKQPGQPTAAQPGPAASAEARGPRLMRNLEERTLNLLMQEGASVPPSSELPEPKIFSDPACRRIYEVFRSLYVETGHPPETRAVLTRLSSDESAMTRLAGIDLKGDPSSGLFGLQQCLENLERVDMDRERQELAAALREAERRGDTALHASLLIQWEALRRSRFKRSLPS